MESGKRAEEAGSSSTGGGVGVGEKKQEKRREMNKKPPSEVICDDDEEEEEEEEDDDGGGGGVKEDCGLVAAFVPGPLLSLKEQIEKDKDDDSLMRWKEKLLGCVEGDLYGEMGPEVKFHSIGIISDDFGEITTPLPANEKQNGCVLFTLKEGSRYQLKLTFSVLYNLVSGLTYSNSVWKGGLQVDQRKGMLGTFAPRREPYVHTLDEETTPSGVLARGIYSAKLKVTMVDNVHASVNTINLISLDNYLS
ncbi:Rho_GDI domain-containing protein [Cephalotus follicularis]|uniref:Rho_GDI domain-containing protein n=1 Tax=Cephalotus follicularis TaxID=3775 RepID=A0A1Q3CNG4_CEPFO|nr:Rho_GDI domain-containing protein [Cephalotus follicularis]